MVQKSMMFVTFALANLFALGEGSNAGEFMVANKIAAGNLLRVHKAEATATMEADKASAADVQAAAALNDMASHEDQQKAAPTAQAHSIKGLTGLLDKLNFKKFGAMCARVAEKWCVEQGVDDVHDLLDNKFAKQFVQALATSFYTPNSTNYTVQCLTPFNANRLLNLLKAQSVWPVAGLKVILQNTARVREIAARSDVDAQQFAASSQHVIDKVSDQPELRFWVSGNTNWLSAKDVKLVQEEPETYEVNADIPLPVFLSQSISRSHCLTKVLMQACLDSHFDPEVKDSQDGPNTGLLTKLLPKAFKAQDAAKIEELANGLCGAGASCSAHAINACANKNAIWCSI